MIGITQRSTEPSGTLYNRGANRHPMPESQEPGSGWFANLDPADRSNAVGRIRDGASETPRPWPSLAVDQGFVPDESAYYDVLHDVAVTATAEAVERQEAADDRQVIHAVRTIDDLDRVSNELAERVAEWARTTALPAPKNQDDVVELADANPLDGIESDIVALASTIRDMRAERTALVGTVDRLMHDIAPNLTALAGPLLGARLIALAGGLEQLAKQPSSTVQVLGAEDALFAHLRGNATSPKHGIIFTHEYVRDTDPAHRGSAARALAGKLAIGARIDHYAGDRRPAIERDLRDRIETIRERSA